MGSGSRAASRAHVRRRFDRRYARPAVGPDSPRSQLDRPGPRRNTVTTPGERLRPLLHREDGGGHGIWSQCCPSDRDHTRRSDGLGRPRYRARRGPRSLGGRRNCRHDGDGRVRSARRDRSTVCRAWHLDARRRRVRMCCAVFAATTVALQGHRKGRLRCLEPSQDGRRHPAVLRALGGRPESAPSDVRIGSRLSVPRRQTLRRIRLRRPEHPLRAA